MSYQIVEQDVWVGTLEDQPGELADKLEAISKPGINLEFMVAFRTFETPGGCRVFLAPLRGEAAARAAEQAGLTRWTTARSLRIIGPDQPGLGVKITRAVADAGVNIRGASAAKLGEHTAFNLAFDSGSDADKAYEALHKALNG